MSEKENAVERNKKNTEAKKKTTSNSSRVVKNNKSTYENKTSNTKKNNSKIENKSVPNNKSTKPVNKNNKKLDAKASGKNESVKKATNVTIKTSKENKTGKNEKYNKYDKKNGAKNVSRRPDNTKKEKSVNKVVDNKKVSDISTKKDIVDKEEKSSVQKGKELVELNKNKNKKVKEETIIQKIKNFLAKIAEMQEEAKREITEIKENVKIKKEKIELDKNKEEKVKVQTNYLLEYYDLPYRYNETVVKILAQTPKKLFVYWDISDKDKEKYIKSFGENFFIDTYPVLLLYNEEKEYVREIVINDFANSWYIDIDDPKTKYTIQLGRKFKSKPEIVNMAVFEEEKIVLQTDYLPIAMSNKIEVPNDHILFENFNSKVLFRNVKTNQETMKDIRKFDKKIAKAYNLNSFYDIYKDLYKDGIENGMFDLNNPTSGNTSSSFK